jgi:hypothetical protein
MVTAPAGKVRWGCLASVALLAIVIYYSIPVGQTYIQYLRMKDEMKAQANFAVNIDDDTIRRRLWAKVDELGLPREARRINIRRRSRPREIVITTTWADTLNLPFYRWPVTLRPEVRAGL